MRADQSAGRLVRLLVTIIETYRHMISPLRPASCRFTPTCSQYAVDALTRFGVMRGGWLTLHDEISLGTLVAFVNFAGMFFNPINQLAQRLTDGLA